MERRKKLTRQPILKQGHHKNERGRTNKWGSNHLIPIPMSCKDMWKDLICHSDKHFVTWLFWCWDNGASSLELEFKEAKCLGTLSREMGTSLSHWKWLLSGVKERYPFKEDVICFRQLKFHKERYPVLEGISHAGGDLWWPGQQPVIQRFRWSQVQVTHVAEVCTEHTIAVCQFISSWMANSSNMKKVSLSLQACV